MNIQIKNRYSDAVIFEGDYVDILEALSAAIKSGANLYNRAHYRGSPDKWVEPVVL